MTDEREDLAELEKLFNELAARIREAVPQGWQCDVAIYKNDGTWARFISSADPSLTMRGSPVGLVHPEAAEQAGLRRIGSTQGMPVYATRCVLSMLRLIPREFTSAGLVGNFGTVRCTLGAGHAGDCEWREDCESFWCSP